ncbi:sensor histidine kinase [Arthrobacter glacialis]|uniref:histidine kinase n=2 Tax=Arthrobacter glacialis TaxID=1664 RepID=A0A2S3ZWH5_ARTGL|nr:ATP-binding protein [Arthrobacter glacialis]POH73523.1 sensor histidine kinase [Arthrobacter glacialis]
MAQKVPRLKLAKSLDRSLIVIFVAVISLAAMGWALLPIAGPMGHVMMLFPVVTVVYLLAGLRAWHRRPGNRLGPLILFGGFAVFLSGMGNTDIPVFVAASTIGATLILAVIVHMLHAFPSGRLQGRISKFTVLAAYLNSLLLQAPGYLFRADGDVPFLAIADSPPMVALAQWLQEWVGAGVMMATAFVLIRRLVQADKDQRRVLAPLFAYGAFAAIFVPLGTQVLSPLLDMSVETNAMLQLIVIGGIPLAFGHGILRGGFAKTGELEELGSWLGASGGARSALAAALVRALGDPSATLSFWVPRHEVFVNDDGSPAPLVEPGTNRGQVEIVLGSRTVGAIAYDATLIEEPALVRAAGQVVAIAVDRERLTVELRESHGALQRSRQRLVDAADRERRRIARDLHDGLQMQLVLLALEAQQLAKSAGSDSGTIDRATHLRQGLDAAAAELRQLVHAVMPAALIERGLAAAAEDLADRMPIPTTLELEITDGSCASAVEHAAYFVLAEALSNALKHSQATQIQVRLHVEEGWLRLEVRDDGKGGADLHVGTGLRGIGDRVDVLGGLFDLASAPGEGTRIKVDLPCA